MEDKKSSSVFLLFIAYIIIHILILNTDKFLMKVTLYMILPEIFLQIVSCSLMLYQLHFTLAAIDLKP